MGGGSVKCHDVLLINMLGLENLIDLISLNGLTFSMVHTHTCHCRIDNRAFKIHRHALKMGGY